MAVRYTPLGGRQTYLSDVERANMQGQMRAADVRNALARHTEALRREDLGAYSRAVGSFYESEARRAEAEAMRQMQERLGMERIGLGRDQLQSQRELAELGILSKSEEAAAAREFAAGQSAEERTLRREGIAANERLAMLKMEADKGNAQAQMELQRLLADRQHELATAGLDLQREDLTYRRRKEEDKPLKDILGAVLVDENSTPAQRQKAVEGLVGGRAAELPADMFRETRLQQRRKATELAGQQLENWDAKLMSFWSRDEGIMPGKDPSLTEANKLADDLIEIGKDLVDSGIPKEIALRMLWDRVITSTATDRVTGTGDADMLEVLKKRIFEKLGSF